MIAPARPPALAFPRCGEFPSPPAPFLPRHLRTSCFLSHSGKHALQFCSLAVLQSPNYPVEVQLRRRPTHEIEVHLDGKGGGLSVCQYGEGACFSVFCRLTKRMGVGIKMVGERGVDGWEGRGMGWQLTCISWTLPPPLNGPWCRRKRATGPLRDHGDHRAKREEGGRRLVGIGVGTP